MSCLHKLLLRMKLLHLNIKCYTSPCEGSRVLITHPFLFKVCSTLMQSELGQILKTL